MATGILRTLAILTQMQEIALFHSDSLSNTITLASPQNLYASSIGLGVLPKRLTTSDSNSFHSIAVWAVNVLLAARIITSVSNSNEILANIRDLVSGLGKAFRGEMGKGSIPCARIDFGIHFEFIVKRLKSSFFNALNFLSEVLSRGVVISDDRLAKAP